MDIHIGAKIKSVAKKRRIKAVELAKMVSKQQPSIHKDFKKKSLDSDLLFLFSKALNYDFFALYTDALEKVTRQNIEANLLGQQPDIGEPHSEANDAEPIYNAKAKELEECRAKLALTTEQLTSLQKNAQLQNDMIDLQKSTIDTLRATIARLEGKKESAT